MTPNQVTETVRNTDTITEHNPKQSQVYVSWQITTQNTKPMILQQTATQIMHNHKGH